MRDAVVRVLVVGPGGRGLGTVSSNMPGAPTEIRKCANELPALVTSPSV
jgi:hypothetical protein